jgi:hypothetical protein
MMAMLRRARDIGTWLQLSALLVLARRPPVLHISAIKPDDRARKKSALLGT